MGNPIFEANPGGAPCNVLTLLQKLGRKPEFQQKVCALMKKYIQLWQLYKRKKMETETFVFLSL